MAKSLQKQKLKSFFFTSVKKSIDASVTNIKNGKKGGAGNTSTTEKFIKPTLEEIKAYCEEIKSQIDPQEFLDHYQKNGWVYGKNKTPIKDWKACVRTWERNERKNEITDTVHNKGDDVL